ncbi:hypothetical protein [Lachnoclostridium sp. Marseille-P6806]|uniref:hypothetical protein n=1 Tax=Lachnoclostridium sp. Marseille-P6806 TaxID=2364793 RepID=UPI00102F6559|nr:hypothetical protein [Lachnoclostridium sp. Marseille-P6806]
MSFEEFDRRLERRLGRYAIRNLSLALILCYAFGYMIAFVNADFPEYLTLNPYAILHGQVWRVLTWILIPPELSNFFFVLIMLFFYYSIGTALERTWGTWRYNEYIFGGMLLTVLGAFALMGWAYAFDAQTLAAAGAENYFRLYSQVFSTYYVNMSIFLAYAVTFPEMQVLFMFIIPVKVKWLGILDAVYMLYTLFVSPMPVRIAIIASLLNFLVLWLRSRDWRRMSPGEIRRRSAWKRSAAGANGWRRGSDGWMHGSQGGPRGAGNPPETDGRGAVRTGEASGSAERGRTVVPFPGADSGARHRCAVCGRTERSNPELEFRYCSKCEGSFEYCSDHIFTHRHVKAGDPGSFDGQGHVKMEPPRRTES